MAYKASKEFREVIRKELTRRAEADAAFAEKFENPSKSVNECCEYIASEVFRRKVNMVREEEIFGLAVHYYDEAGIEFKPAPDGRVVVPANAEEVARAVEALTSEEKEELKRKAEERYLREQMEAMKPKAAKRKPSKVPAESHPLPFTEQTLF